MCFLLNSVYFFCLFGCRCGVDFEKNKKKREIFRLKERKTAPAPFLETIPLNVIK